MLTRAAFTPIIFYSWWIEHEHLYIFQNALAGSMCSVFYINHVSDHLPVFWWSASVGSLRECELLDDKERRRSTRWPTPDHFLFESAPTARSCKLFPARKGLPVVLSWWWLANSMLWPFPHQECHQAECVATVRGGGRGLYAGAALIIS